MLRDEQVSVCTHPTNRNASRTRKCTVGEIKLFPSDGLAALYCINDPRTCTTWPEAATESCGQITNRDEAELNS